MSFRLAPDQWRRFEKVVKQRGQTKQAFIEGLVFSEIAAQEERRQSKEPVISSNVADFGPSSSSLVDMFRRRDANQAPPVSEPTPPAGVVVNVGSTAGKNSSDDIATFATYVGNGKNDFEREARLRVAAEILRDVSATDEECKVLAAKLDEAIAAKTKQPTEGAESASGIIKAARFTFDKLFG